MLVDEPTSSLDPETSHDVMGLLTEIAREEGIPVLINIHEVDLAVEYADRIVGLANGQVVYDGPASDLDKRAEDVIYRDGEQSTRSVTDSSMSTDRNGVDLHR